ncbi:MAG TPA: AAA family ATPase, partial [Vicinamibacteria bacterium]|nr:AAA family ATPase [Vicinamibacteria bacterium]
MRGIGWDAVPVVSYLPAEILDYIETHAPPQEAAFGISQAELAKALGYHPCSMSRPLADLVGGGALKVQRGPVRGGIRKHLVYALTERGREKLQRQTSDVPLLSGALPPPPNPFLGRKEELKVLRQYSEGGGTLIFVEGPGGMGKTALVSRHIRRLKAGRVPFWFTARAGSSPRHVTVALSHALSPLGAQQLAYYAQLPRMPVGREVADLALRALGNRDLMMVVDDIQAANSDVRKFLQEFVTGIFRGRHDLVFFVGQERPFFAAEGIPTHHLVVGGLDRVAAHDLTDRRGGLADRFESVYQASLGSPLLLQLAASNPDVQASAMTLPAAVVERLSSDDIEALLPIALANEPLPISFVTEATDLSATRLQQQLQSGILQKALEQRVEML